jgi:hypothetical protein
MFHLVLSTVLAAMLTLGFGVSVTAETLVPAKIEEQSPKESLRKELFSSQLNTRACKILSRDPAGVVEKDAALSKTLMVLIKGIKESDDLSLLPLFHPQIKVKKSAVKSALISIERITGPKPDASLFRAYGINNPTGDVAATDCLEDGLKVFPVYGHPLQVGAWIQATGKDEVARVYVVLIPTKDQWRIAVWHVQQWTHAGKDFTSWRSEASELAAKKEELAAWIYLDLAIKLLDGGKYLEFPVAGDLGRERADLLGGKSLLEAMKPKFFDETIVYASSLFSRHGASFLLRFRIPGEWSANAIKKHCSDHFKRLSAESWTRAIAGMRCDYVLPSESTTKEGALGGIFIDR